MNCRIDIECLTTVVQKIKIVRTKTIAILEGHSVSFFNFKIFPVHIQNLEKELKEVRRAHHKRLQNVPYLHAAGKMSYEALGGVGTL